MNEQEQHKTFRMLKRSKRTKLITCTSNIVPLFTTENLDTATNTAMKDGFRIRHINGKTFATVYGRIGGVNLGNGRVNGPVIEAADGNNASAIFTHRDNGAGYNFAIDMPEGIYIRPSQVVVDHLYPISDYDQYIYGISKATNKGVNLAGPNAKNRIVTYNCKSNEWFKTLYTFMYTANIANFSIPKCELYVEADSPYNHAFDKFGTVTYLD